MTVCSLLEPRSARFELLGHPRRLRSLAFAAVGLALILGGCAAQNPAQPTVATVNQDITQAIAAAGAAANTAEQQYKAGQIPQTAAARTAINSLGAAYNDARAAYLTYLSAVTVQAAACQPASVTAGPGASTTTTPSAAASGLTVNGQAVTCASATAAVSTANAALTPKVAAMATATTAVQSLAKK